VKNKKIPRKIGKNVFRYVVEKKKSEVREGETIVQLEIKVKILFEFCKFIEYDCNFFTIFFLNCLLFLQ
jgi:hypothetical protein